MAVFGICRRDLYAAALLFVLASLFSWNILANPDKMMYSKYSDIISPFSPWRQFIADSLSRYNEIPLWNPYMYSGSPFVSNIQAIVFYPLSFPLLLGNVAVAFGYVLIIHIFLAGLFCYMFMRRLEVGRFGSLLSASAFMFTGNITAKLYAAQALNITTITWIPLLFLAAELVVGRREWKYGCLLGTAIALQFLAGQAQIFLYSMLALFLYFLYRLACIYRDEKAYKGMGKCTGIFVLAIFVALMLSAVQALPVAELISHFYRKGGVSYEFATNFFSIPPEQLVTLLLPDFFGNAIGDTYQGAGNFWESTFYVGILPLAFAILAFITKRDKYTIFFAALAMFALLFSFGSYTPLFSIFYNFVPGFNLFRQPGKMLIFFSFSVAVLAGFGASALLDRNGKRERIKKNGMLLAVLAVLAVLATASAVIFREKIISLSRSFVAGRYAAHMGPEFPVEYYYGLIEPIYNGIVNNMYVLSLLLLLSAVIFFLTLKGRTNQKYIKILAMAVILADLWFFGMRYITMAEPETVFVKNDINLFLENDTGMYRVFALNSTLPFHIAYLSGVYMVEGYDPLPLRDYMGFEYAIVNISLGTLCRGCYPPPLEELCANGCYPQLLDLLNVKYVITTEPLTNKSRFELKFNKTVEYGIGLQSKHVYLYENKYALPRVFFVTNFMVKSREDVLETLKSGDFDYRNYVALEGNVSFGAENQTKTTKSNISVTYYSPNKVVISAETQKAGFLVFSDVWYPGWEAYVNGQKAEIYRADYILKAVQLEAGNNTVDFIYNPMSYRIGLYITLSSIIILAVILGLWCCKNIQKEVAAIVPNHIF